MAVFVIEDASHAEWQGEFRQLDDALAELRRRAASAWDSAPNRPPCSRWETCRREYTVIEFDDRAHPWRERSRTLMLTVDAAGPIWHVPA
ncbi:hypothetical protein LBW59_21260 [Ralstonia solanacearum]|uniref:Uncharacterized protein n=1 Tax=Ralstonia solanacearum TaxID=305 RepID=A0AAW5ZU63_RALSL|nr:hypothetical protein [Ralstonia solanacearum]MBB6593456.1 hypothetical protein [Ralstonia solanacearum]MBB6597683.1 hypothetical protein [Ralstonia solanacearum]MDB0543231.1 hypothetical protein [Ralstonia solanacearum]MDB0552639.1 hypothetical protein [Ralstonia solanacearum]MDB0558211.1 hypothetical protein [Ralstonia solanacearum]